MGRNKKKSKAAAHAASDSEEERDEELGDAAAPEQVAQAETAAAAPAEHSGRDSDDDSDAPKKKKEYRGNRLNKQDKKKKGKHANEEDKAAEAADGGDGGDGEPPAPTRLPAVEVLYCPMCSFPAEMCEFAGMMDKCRPWLLEHAAELADAEDRGRKRRILTEKGRLEALLEGRGIKKALERIVLLDVEKRTGRRMVTSVFGMDLFGFNLKDISRDWRKRFSCGAGIRAAEEGKHQDCIDIQGNVAEQLAEMLITTYKVPKESVYIMEGKKKVPYPF
ncbi:Translation initiation factor SUI1 [Novymonas esmeraldas]|uniref:Translation initiation factor SUI1 n=1 Tax=Novymonas esmeraldas TaxID=1808958 RepID=A0AAW0F2Q6_9TRYP